MFVQAMVQSWQDCVSHSQEFNLVQIKFLGKVAQAIPVSISETKHFQLDFCFILGTWSLCAEKHTTKLSGWFYSHQCLKLDGRSCDDNIISKCNQ